MTSLEAYRDPRAIVQNVRGSVLEAALAMRLNEIGCVLVSDARSVVGIVTDRDLAARVVAAGRDPRLTRLGDIMSSPIVTLDVGAPHAEALRLMRERGIRRVPLVEGKRVVGMVTLDDLLLERAATLEEQRLQLRDRIGIMSFTGRAWSRAWRPRRCCTCLHIRRDREERTNIATLNWAFAG